MDFKRTNKKLPSILNVGWVSFGIIIFLLILSLSANGSFLLIAILGYFGAVIGNAIRIYAMPTFYSTDGTVLGSFYKRLYWNHGPQIGGFISIFIIILILAGRG